MPNSISGRKCCAAYTSNSASFAKSALHRQHSPAVHEICVKIRFLTVYDILVTERRCSIRQDRTTIGSPDDFVHHRDFPRKSKQFSPAQAIHPVERWSDLGRT
jgi:hypothetical protein